jgi:hypothetical protein
MGTIVKRQLKLVLQKHLQQIIPGWPDNVFLF